MNEMKLCCRTFLTVTVMLLLATGTAFAEQTGDVGSVEFYDDALQLDLKQTVANATISISGPDGFSYQEDLHNGAVIPLDWMEAVEDGYYKYEITGASTKKVKNRKIKMNNGREHEPDMVNVSESQSGGFRIKNGVVVNPNITEQEKYNNN